MLMIWQPNLHLIINNAECVDLELPDLIKWNDGLQKLLHQSRKWEKGRKLSSNTFFVLVQERPVIIKFISQLFWFFQFFYI